MFDRRERGILALTISSILILAGIWFVFFSSSIAHELWQSRIVSRTRITEYDVKPNETVTYNVYVEGSQKLYVWIQPDDHRFDVKIFDSKNNLVYSYRGNIDFKPLKTDVYRVEIFNRFNKTFPFITSSISIYQVLFSLEQVGFLLILVSIPLCMYGIILVVKSKK